MADERDFYFPLSNDAEDIDSTLSELIGIKDEENDGKVVKIEYDAEGEVTHFIAGEVEDSQTIDVDVNEIPIGDGNDWVKASDLYLSQNDLQGYTYLWNTNVKNWYADGDHINNTFFEITFSDNDNRTKTYNLWSRIFATTNRIIDLVPDGYEGNRLQIKLNINYAIYYNSTGRYDYNNKTFFLNVGEGTLYYRLSNFTSFFGEIDVDVWEDNETITPVLKPGITTVVGNEFSFEYNVEYHSCNMSSNEINFQYYQSPKAQLKINDGYNETNNLGGQHRAINEITLECGAKLFLGLNPSNISKYTLYEHSTSGNPINVLNTPNVKMRGAVYIDIDSGTAGVNEGCASMIVHGGVHFDINNYYGNTMPFMPPCTFLDLGIENEDDVGVIIHGNTRVLLEHSANLKMAGDSYVDIQNSSVIIQSVVPNQRDPSNGFNNFCEVVITNGLINISGDSSFCPTFIMDKNSIKMRSKGNPVGAWNNFPDSLPWAWNSNRTNCGPIFSVASNTVVCFGNEAPDHDHVTGSTYVKCGGNGGSELILDITPGGNSYTRIKFGGQTGSQIDYSFAPASSTNTVYRVQTKGQLNYFLETSDGFIQLVDNVHIEAVDEPKIIFRGMQHLTNDKYSPNNPHLSPTDFVHLDLDWRGLLTTDQNTYLQDYDSQYGTASAQGPSPIVQMFGGANFTMRPYMTGDPHTIKSTAVPAPLFEMTVASEFRMWDSAYLKMTNGAHLEMTDGGLIDVSSTNGIEITNDSNPSQNTTPVSISIAPPRSGETEGLVTMSDGTQTIQFTLTQLATALNIQPVGNNLF